MAKILFRRVVHVRWIWRIRVRKSESRSGSWESWDGVDLLRIWIVDGNGLIRIGIVVDDGLGEYVERSSNQHVVCGVANNVNLKVKVDTSDFAMDVSGKSKRSVARSIC